MDNVLKKRLVGTAVIVALAVIFLPMMLEGPGKATKEVTMQISIPDRPSYDIPNRLADAESVNEPEPEPDVKDLTKESLASKVTESAAKSVDAAVEAPEKAAVVAQIPVVSDKVPQAVKKIVEVPAAAKPELKKKPEEKSAASQISTETRSAGFAIQVGSFSKKDNAQALKTRLVAAGYPAFVDASKIKGSDIYRVKVGPKPSRKLANQIRIELIDEEKLEGIIVRHP